MTSSKVFYFVWEHFGSWFMSWIKVSQWWFVGAIEVFFGSASSTDTRKSLNSDSELLKFIAKTRNELNIDMNGSAPKVRCYSIEPEVVNRERWDQNINKITEHIAQTPSTWILWARRCFSQWHRTEPFACVGEHRGKSSKAQREEETKIFFVDIS